MIEIDLFRSGTGIAKVVAHLRLEIRISHVQFVIVGGGDDWWSVGDTYMRSFDHDDCDGKQFDQ